MRRGLCAAFFLLVFAGGVVAEPLASIPNPRVKNGTWVTDTAGALKPDTIDRLNALIGEVERTRGIEMAVVVIRSLDGLAIEDAAVKLFEMWKIGKKGKDNGLLLLWSTGDRKVRVEVGYGLEGTLNDGKAGAILDTYVIPKFKANQFDEGVLSGVEKLLGAQRGDRIVLPAVGKSYAPVAPVAPLAPVARRSQGWRPSGWLLALWLSGPIALFLSARSMFRRWRRYRSRTCPQCRTRMLRLSETDDDESLDQGQVAEERVGSVDYDVWKCPSCAYQFVLRYAKWATKYDMCPQCSNRTKWRTRTIVEAATRHGDGLAKIVEQCAFCNYKVEYETVLPQLTSSSSSSGGGYSSSSGGGGSSSSFGGGRSGGGGASRGY